jgi:hypothetical protein
MPNPYELLLAYNVNYVNNYDGGDDNNVDYYPDFTDNLARLAKVLSNNTEVQTAFFDPESESDSDEESKKLVSESYAKPDTESDTESESDSDAKSDTESGTESDTESYAKPDTESDMESEKISINSFMTPVNNINNFIQPLDDTFTSFKVNVDNTKPKLSILDFVK